MQSNYEYLKMSSKEAPFILELVAGKSMKFNIRYYALYEDLRSIEDNYRLLKRLDTLLRDPKECDLSNMELKIALRSCAHSIVQTVCRLLEAPKKKADWKQTNCIYSRIQLDIGCENTKQRALARYRNLVNQQWYPQLRIVRDKRISHQEGFFDTYSVQLIGELLSKPTQNMIDEIRALLEFCASANLNGGRAKYVSRPLDSNDS